MNLRWSIWHRASTSESRRRGGAKPEPPKIGMFGKRCSPAAGFSPRRPARDQAGQDAHRRFHGRAFIRLDSLYADASVHIVSQWDSQQRTPGWAMGGTLKSAYQPQSDPTTCGIRSVGHYGDRLVCKAELNKFYYAAVSVNSCGRRRHGVLPEDFHRPTAMQVAKKQFRHSKHYGSKRHGDRRPHRR